jgi:hypothetical protein
VTRPYVRGPVNERLPTIGDLRHPIIIAKRTRMPDLDFGFTEQLTVVRQCWSRMTNIEGVPYSGTDSSREGTWMTHEFLVRRDPDLDTYPGDNHYVVWRNRRYHIGGVWEYDREQRFIGLLATVEQAAVDLVYLGASHLGTDTLPFRLGSA